MQSLRQSWLSILSRLQSVATRERGAVVLTIRVLVVDGEPQIWSEPKLTRLEPLHRVPSFVSLILEELAQD